MIQIGAPSATIDQPIEHLMACHRRIEQRLDALVRAATHLETDRKRALAAIASSLEFLDSSGMRHTEDEENSLFPRLRTRVSQDEIAYLASLEDQHEEADSTLARLKELTREAQGQTPVPRRVIEEYGQCAEKLRSIYQDHIRSEDAVLTAMAKQCLSEAELSEISREMRERRASGAKL